MKGDNMTYESKDRQWFALSCLDNMLVTPVRARMLGWNYLRLHPLGDCGDFDAAEEIANDLGLDAIWIADAETVKQWADTIRTTIERM